MTAAITPDGFQRALAITRAAYQDVVRADPGFDKRFPKAGSGLDRAQEELAANKLGGPAYMIANAAKDIAGDFYLREDPDRARELLELAVRLYEFRNDDGRYTQSIDRCRENLLALGSVSVQPAVTPDAAAEARAQPAPRSPSVPQSQVPQQAAVATAHAPTLPAIPSPAAPPPSTPSTRRHSGDADGADVREPNADAPPNWEQLLRDWRSGLDGETLVEHLFDGLGELISDLVTRNAPASADRLAAVIADDLRVLAEELAGVTVDVEGHLALHQRAIIARSVSQMASSKHSRGGTPAELRQVRAQWLTSALWNHALCRHWPSNGYQTVADILGYLQMIQIENRYRPDQRELLLAVSESAAQIAIGELKDSRREKVRHVFTWLRHAVGVQLHVGGPDPVAPEDSTSHARVQNPNEPGRHLHPETWAVHLLSQWVHEEEHWYSVAFILLNLAGWKADRLEGLLDGLYRTPPGVPVSDEARRVRDFWHELAMKALATTRTVRVVKNAWEPGVVGASSSLSTRDQDDFVQLSNRLLQGMAAELAPRAHGTMVQGALFSGRPVPTYLTFNNFGPVGVLKIDEAAKVQREKENFDEFGELLHPFYRSSKCVVGSTTIANSTNGRRYQAILTSYVFRDRDEPTTLRDWLRTAGAKRDDTGNKVLDEQGREVVDPNVLRDVVEELFLDALGPWLSNASRSMGDLRGEYPALRPATFERTSYAPGKDAESELAHFTSDEVARTFGSDGGLSWRSPTLEPLLHGSALGRSPLVDDAAVTNPLWLVAHIADVAKPGGSEEAALFDWLLYDRQYGLTTRSYLTCVSHGDLHGENVLVSGPDGRPPALYIIDFETTHRGHICKDFARLESALWSRTFVWKPDQLSQIRAWFSNALNGEALWTAQIPGDVDPEVQRVLNCVTKLRTILKGCEQRNWPINDLEYQWALLASLLPFARYRDHEDPVNRHLPFLLAADVADSLVTRARTAM
ncbi:phosphotransferase [Streptomyces sp. NPDC050287]|uniref:phosphotransferase n=1 Tax=Streptomyces sp. NPDC050287 TaxID=3365608 RepID=UPI0037B8FBDF